MLTPDPVESERILKSIVATLSLLLIISNVMWYIAYTTATGPLGKATPTPTVTMTPLRAASPTATDIGRSPAPTVNTGVSPTVRP